MVFWCLMIRVLYGADPVFSGLQKGERLSGFRVVSIVAGDTSAVKRERDPVAEAKNQPMTVVFVHTIERSLVPLLRAIDEYGHGLKPALTTEVVFLATDRIAGEERVRAAMNSLRLKSAVGLSLDGGEGPGNYGLNKECMMTLMTAKDGRVLGNFALVQPGIADASAVLQAMGRASGLTNAASVEAFLTQWNARGRAEPRMGPAGGRTGGGNGSAESTNATAKGKDPFPGEVPTDPKLNTLLRQFIRPTNDVATVDRLRAEVVRHLGTNAELRRQAVGGWTRVLHFGDRYGTEYSRKVGRELMSGWTNAAVRVEGEVGKP